jgi:hypothetical protein
MNPLERMRVPNSSVCVLVLLLLFASRFQAFSEDRDKMLVYYGMTLRIPPNVKIKKYKGVDYGILTFIHNREGVLNVYFGNWPDINEIKFQQRRKLGNNLVSIRRSSVGQRVTNDTLLFRGESAWPEYLHFFYKDVAVSEAKLADAIISETINLNAARR